jgi:UDP-N-acetylmuramate dehydrogenase
MFGLSENISLKNYNTFGIDANARYFLTIESPDDIVDFFGLNKNFLKEERLILGGGSNLLFTSDFNGLIIYPDIHGIRVISEFDQIIEIEVGAGERWDDFVALCVEKGWGGTENLSLIPGNVGAVPVQNIGAYGVEAESIILTVNGIFLDTLEKKSIAGGECEFEYRNSIFKTELKGKFIVTSVVFRLQKNPSYVLTYGILKTELAKYEEVNLKTVRNAVISIRESKLPDPKKIGNAGSFFKNPVVKIEVAEKIKNQFEGIPTFTEEQGKVKIAAGWLIEKSGWKGKSLGNAAVHDKQALVIVNKGNAIGEEIYKLSQNIQRDVYSKFGIELEPEVNIIGEKEELIKKIAL